MIFLLLSVSLNSYIPTAEAQLAPEVELVCDPSATMSVNSSSQKVTYVLCEIENPTTHTITVQVNVESELAAIGPSQEITINRFSKWSFIVTYHGDIDTISRSYESTVKTTITRVNSVNYDPGGTESYDVNINVEQYITCQYDLKHQLLVVGAGSPIIVKSNIFCQSNGGFSKEFQAIIVSRSSDSKTLPPGFEYENNFCVIENSSDSISNTKDCEFKISTPIYLLKTWDSCVIIIEKDTENDNFCYESLSMEIKVKTRIWWVLSTIVIITIGMWMFQERLQEFLGKNEVEEN